MIINYFLILTTLLLMAGLVLDAGLLGWRHLYQQNAADAAALEAMFEKTRNDNAWATAGQAQSAQNGFTNGVNGASVTIVNPPTSGPFANDTLAFQATISQSVGNLFMGLINGGKSTVTAIASARIMPTCVWIMNPAGGGGSLNLASAGMYPSCGVYVNASTGYNLSVDGFATLRSTRNRVVGPSTLDRSSGTESPKARYGTSPKLDPLNYVIAPVFSSCTYTNLNVTSGSYTVYPGTYCNMTASNSTINLAAGLYLFTGGLSLTNCTLTGTGVMIYFTKQPSDLTYGTVSFRNSTVSLRASTTTYTSSAPVGPVTAGIAMFTDRAWIDHGGQDVQLVNTPVTMDGIWYFPNTGLYLWQSAFNYYNYNGLVIDNIYQYGASSYFSPNYATIGNVSPYHYDDGVLVQ